MKRYLPVFLWFLLLLNLLFFCTYTIAFCFSYKLVLASFAAFFAVIAVLSGAATALSLIYKERIESKFLAVLSSFIFPLSVINAFICLFESQNAFCSVFILINEWLCLYLTIKHSKPLVLKIISIILSVVLILPLNLMCMMIPILSDFGEKNVIFEIDSPNKEYCAQVVSHDQGALGGNTYVEVKYYDTLDVFFFKIVKQPLRVCRGNYNSIFDIYWKNDRCLTVNSHDHIIK